MDDNDKKVASPASSNTAQLWTEKYRQSLGYFVLSLKYKLDKHIYLTDECLLVLRDCPNRGNNRRYERRMNKLGNEYDDYSEDDCKEREMFPAQSGRPRKWHDLREGVRGPDLSGLAPLSNIKFRIVWEDELLKREIVREEGIHFSDSWAIELDEISGNSTRERFRLYVSDKPERNIAKFFDDLSGLAPLSNIKFRIVWEDELLKREIVREEGIHFSDSWAIELDEISGNSTRENVYSSIQVESLLSLPYDFTFRNFDKQNWVDNYLRKGKKREGRRKGKKEGEERDLL
ncbi:hypothetical protein RhiirA1_509541 [Rhizophagus irregularis]|uniref:Uncharacterized protein n=1 Tax=Rhizophagus irregularis TaxID=588596 RepID=A0A2N0RVW3_9GLOM|nr:hypothetical protein RhiirA1_509541 [Rhizophagus irregularis]